MASRGSGRVGCCAGLLSKLTMTMQQQASPPAMPRHMTVRSACSAAPAHHVPCSKEQRDRFRLSTGGAQQEAPPQDSCPVLLLLAMPPPPLPLPPLLLWLAQAAAALAAAESGAKQCRKPARVSTACTPCHLLVLPYQRSMLPCLQQCKPREQRGRIPGRQGGLRGSADRS